VESIVLSIIIPTCNSGAYLREALESIICQTFTEYEVLIIDNVSIDNTPDIVADFTSFNDNIRFISEPDNGIYDAMNKGIGMAKGRWLYFLGSDDKLYNESVLANIFSTTKTIAYNVIYGDVLIDGDTGWAKSGQIYDGEFNLAKLINRNICHQAMFFKREVFINHGLFDLQYNVCSDWDVNLRLWSLYPFMYIRQIVAVFKGGNSSYQLSNNFNEIDKWESIIHYFKAGILSKEFSDCSHNFLELSNFYRKKHKFFKSFIMRIVYFKHNKRIYIL